MGRQSKLVNEARQRQAKSSNVSLWRELQAVKTLTSEADVFAVAVDGDAETVALSPVQWQAVQLIVAGRRGVDVAAELDVTPETVSRWRALPVFQAALNVGVRDSYCSTIGRLRDARTGALDVLCALLQSEDERLRLSAALSVLRLHLALDAGAQALPTTPAAVAADRERAMLWDSIG